MLQLFFKHEINMRVNHERKIAQKMFKVDLHTTKEFGHSKKAFQFAKGKTLPPFRTVSTTVCDDGIVAAMDDPSMIEIFVSTPSKFLAGNPISINEHLGSLCQINPLSLQVKFVNTPTFDVEEVQVEQIVAKTDLSSVFHSLSNYRNQFWQREDTLEEIDFSPEDVTTLSEIRSIITDPQ